MDVQSQVSLLSPIIQKFKQAGIQVSLFIDSDLNQIEKASEIGAHAIELHTGEFALEYEKGTFHSQLEKLIQAAEFAHSKGLRVNAGHGLNIFNIACMKQIPFVHTLNIGHAIIGRSVLYGIQNAVLEILEIEKVEKG